MHGSHARKKTELDGRDVEVQFSPRLRHALADLAASLHFSEHFDGDIYGILQSWSEGKRQTVHDILVAFPSVAEEAFRHIEATGDQRTRDAWSEIRTQMPEEGFALTQKASRAKER